MTKNLTAAALSAAFLLCGSGFAFRPIFGNARHYGDYQQQHVHHPEYHRNNGLG